MSYSQRVRSISTHFFLFLMTACSLILLSGYSHAESASSFVSIPPLINASASGDKPNVLIVLDNSNSMDETPAGQAVGSANPGSKSEMARVAVRGIIYNFGERSRIGLMGYKQTNVRKQKLHDSQYDVSFDPANYAPDYNGHRDSQNKNKRTINPTDPDNYIYYNIALPYYASENYGNEFCYSKTANFDDGLTDSDTYLCSRKKTGTSDSGTDGFEDPLYTAAYVPTESDDALNITDFGTYTTSQYVGDAWFSDESPGKGFLHVAIDDVDSAHRTVLMNKLATSQFTTITDTPLRNAGPTPLAGTLESAGEYFAGMLGSSDAASGVSTALPPANQCGVQNFVVLVTDGLPSADKTGSTITDAAAGIQVAADEAAALLAAGIRTYVVGFGLPPSVDGSLLDKIAEAGGTEKTLLARDPATLDDALSGIFLNIFNRASSSSAAAVLANNARGEGAVFQALYSPSIKDSNGAEVTWAGSLFGLFIDRFGLLREDTNGNGQLDGYDVDRTANYIYNAGENKTEIELYVSGDAATPPNIETGSPVETVPLNGIKPLWRARDQLNAISDPVTQRDYSTSAANGRYILSSIDGVNTLDFKPVADDDPFLRYLDTGSGETANNVVRFIRGEEGISGFRNRTLDYDGDGELEVWRLGDIVNSTPALVGSPSSGYDVVHGDDTYAEFREQYKDRRNVVYVGANDGMLHAFNAGFWNAADRSFETTDAFTITSDAAVAHPLGSELWAYIPKAALPHLQWLTDPNYAHTYYVDGQPQTFDVNIFPDDATHPNGWGTVLVVGMGLGGGTTQVDSDADATTAEETLRSSYIVLDITDPEQPPELLAEISHDNLAFTTSAPALFKQRVRGTSFDAPSQDNWYLIFGSGPTDLGKVISDQSPRIYVYDLEAKAFEPDYPKIVGDAGYANSFVGDVSVVDWEENYSDDTAYFGIISGDPASSSSGAVERLRISSNGIGTISTLVDTGRPVTARPHLTKDGQGRRWVYFGTGRLFSAADNVTTAQNRFYGLYEPVNSSGVETSAEVFDTSLFNVTNIVVKDTGVVTNGVGSSVVMPDASEVDTFNQLKFELPRQRLGWYRNLENVGTNPTERNVSKADSIRSVLFYTTYKPSTNQCTPEGTSRLFGVDFQTGVAPAFKVFSPEDSSETPLDEVAPPSILLGPGLASAPAIVSNDTGGRLENSSDSVVTIVTQSSTGQMQLNAAKVGTTSSTRQSWREITK